MLRHVIKDVLMLALIGIGIMTGIGCSHAGAPTTPGNNSRTEDTFGSTAALFTAAQGTYGAVDMAVLGEYKTPPGQNEPSLSGAPANVPYNGNDAYWTAAVSLNYDSANGDVMNYAWLKDGSTMPIKAGTIGSAGGQNVEYRCPRVAAIHVAKDPVGDSEIILAVAYQSRIVGYDWHINLWIVKWTQSNFPLGNPTSFAIPFFNDSGNQMFPDIAFDFDSTDLYLAYTAYDSDLDQWLIEYRHIYRYSAYQWNAAGPYFACNPNHGQNAWLPRIDVGYLQPSGYEYAEPFVGIVYTAMNYDDRAHYSVAVNYWAVSDGDANHEYYDTMFYNSTYSDYDAGLPDIDISPNNSPGVFYFGIVYVQAVPAHHAYEVWLATSFNGTLYPIANPLHTDYENISPSIALHYGDQYDHYASVSMLEDGTNSTPVGPYHAFATIVDLDDGTQSLNQGWVPVSTTDIVGTWTPADVVTADPGPPTEIVTLPWV